MGKVKLAHHNISGEKVCGLSLSLITAPAVRGRIFIQYGRLITSLTFIGGIVASSLRCVHHGLCPAVCVPDLIEAVHFHARFVPLASPEYCSPCSHWAVALISVDARPPRLLFFIYFLTLRFLILPFGFLLSHPSCFIPGPFLSAGCEG